MFVQVILNFFYSGNSGLKKGVCIMPAKIAMEGEKIIICNI